MQSAAEMRIELDKFSNEFAARMADWENGLRAGQTGQWQAAVEDTLRRWRAKVDGLRTQSQMLDATNHEITDLERKIGEIMQAQTDLATLRAQAATREGQAGSLNPKVVPSPYTNILGLQRTFRDSTRFTILILSILFGIVAIGLLGWLTYMSVFGMMGGAVGSKQGSMVGGSSKNSAHR